MHVEYNYKYDCIVDPYTYSGTAILRNKFNIRDSSVLSKVERRITEAKLVLLQTRQLPRGHYDLKHLQAMHKYLFGDIYDWAGEIREALQKYPEQSFAQKFSLCNRQKFSGRKIKEGF